MRVNVIPILLFSILLYSCSADPIPVQSEYSTWTLGWRLIQNTMDERYQLAENQFDSLLESQVVLDPKFILAGLEAKHKLNKNLEVKKILNKQGKSTLRDICFAPFLKEMKPCSGFIEEKVKNKDLQFELVKMYINDQYVRLNLMDDLLSKYGLAKKNVILDTFGVFTDEKNTSRLQELILEHGFPTKELVGQDAMNGVFNIIQHSDDRQWQKDQLENIKHAVDNGDLDGNSFAFLYDRVKMLNEEKQLYGSQVISVDPIKRTVNLAPIEHLDQLDFRRMKLGMRPIEMYKRSILENY